MNDPDLVKKGLSNYWELQLDRFLCTPHNAYGASSTPGQEVQEFKAMVTPRSSQGRHRGDRCGVQPHGREPSGSRETLSFQGIDTAYRLVDRVGATITTPPEPATPY
jgi:glycogen operon protein